MAASGHSQLPHLSHRELQAFKEISNILRADILQDVGKSMGVGGVETPDTAMGKKLQILPGTELSGREGRSFRKLFLEMTCIGHAFHLHRV